MHLEPRMATTPFIDVIDVSDDHAHLSADRLPRSAILLGCRMCGLPAPEHGRSVIHRFVRPDLPPGYRYLDEVRVGDELTLRRRPPEQPTIVVTELEPSTVPNEEGLLWLRTARQDCFLLHPATIVRGTDAA
jgi:hypothetical protein